MGVDEVEIQRWSLESLQYKDLLDFTIQRKKSNIKFNSTQLPEGEELDINNPKHKVYVDYLLKRKIDIHNYEFIVTPNDDSRNRYRIVIPYYYKNKIVGNTSRFLDNRTPKYINNQQPGYVFNTNKQKQDYQVCIVTEGIFDAISIDGVAIMHDDISNEQSEILNSLGKRIIVVPDHDEAGLKITDRALELGYSVSLPDWHVDVKDVNDAVVRYGKLPTLLSILQYATNSKIKIQIQKRKIMNGRGL
jgi:DNA primase